MSFMTENTVPISPVKMSKENIRALSPQKIEVKQPEPLAESLVLGQREPNIQQDISSGKQCQNDKVLCMPAQNKDSNAPLLMNEVAAIIGQSQPLLPMCEEKKKEVENVKAERKSPSKRRKTAHATESKYNKSSSDEQNEEKKEMKAAKQRKMTMESPQKNPQTFNICEQRKVEKEKDQKKKFIIGQGQMDNRMKVNMQPTSENEENILQPSKKMLQLEKAAVQNLVDISKCKSRIPFLFQGIPFNTRFIFEAVIEKNSIFSRQYSFWLVGQKTKTLLMVASKSISLLKDQFIINGYEQESGDFKFMAKMESNLTRSQLILTNEPEDVQDNRKNIFADLTIYEVNDNTPIMAVYFPQFDKNNMQQRLVKEFDDPNILKTLSKTEEYISYLSPCHLNPNFEKLFRQNNQLISTKKALSLMDKQGILKYYVGKREFKRYHIYAGSGMSPLIACATFIALFES